MRFFFQRLPVAALSLLAAACGQTTTPTTAAGAASAAALLLPGSWRGELATQGQTIPFLFEVKTEGNNPVVYLLNQGLNGEERLRCNEITAAGDSVTIRLHVFDAALVVRADGPRKLRGTWVKYDTKEPYRVPLTATLGRQPLFQETAGAVAAFTGTWRTTFTSEKGHAHPAIGVFKQAGAALTGTFLTPTGDYRYLAGRVDGNGLRLSTFDGSHAYLFTGKMAAGAPPATSSGDFYSGKTGHETWTATLDPTAKLPDADTLTYLKKGESRLKFDFPSIVPGQRISPTDPKYRGKVVVVQILGSWCPNCMDETAYLAPWYLKNKARGVEIIGLGYERSPNYEKAAARLRKTQERYQVGYDLAVGGVSDTDSVARSLPQLATFKGFPTTIFLDKKGVVRAIHTGFAGPGTGKYYAEEIAHFNQTVDKLLKE